MVPLPIARRANYPIRYAAKGSKQIDTAFGVTHGPREVSETRYRECNYLYTKDSTECKYSAAGTRGFAFLSQFRHGAVSHRCDQGQLQLVGILPYSR